MSPTTSFTHPVMKQTRVRCLWTLCVVALALSAAMAGGSRSFPVIHKENRMNAAIITNTHIRLLVKDYDKEFRFFRDVLGFKSTFGAEGGNYADFDCNGVTIALFKRSLMSE